MNDCVKMINWLLIIEWEVGSVILQNRQVVVVLCCVCGHTLTEDRDVGGKHPRRMRRHLTHVQARVVRLYRVNLKAPIVRVLKPNADS